MTLNANKIPFAHLIILDIIGTYHLCNFRVILRPISRYTLPSGPGLPGTFSVGIDDPMDM